MMMNWSSIVAEVLRRECAADGIFEVVTAGLTADVSGETRPDSLITLGPEHFHAAQTVPEAVTLSAALAGAGRIPICVLPSSSLLCSLDPMVRTVCMQNLHVVFVIEGAGLADAEEGNPQGILDLSCLTMIPNLTVMAPKHRFELADMLRWALRSAKGPTAVCCPAGRAYDGLEEFRAPVEYGRWEILYDESDICLLAAGNMVETAQKVRDLMKWDGANCSLINCRFLKPMDEETLRIAASEHILLVTMEENVAAGGFGEHVVSCLSQSGIHAEVEQITLPDTYMDAGPAQLLRQQAGIDAQSILRRIQTRMIGHIR